MLNRRLFLRGAALALAAPAIVRASSIMRVTPLSVPEAVAPVPAPYTKIAVDPRGRVTSMYTGEVGVIENFRVICDQAVPVVPRRTILVTGQQRAADNGVYFVSVGPTMFPELRRVSDPRKVLRVRPNPFSPVGAFA